MSDDSPTQADRDDRRLTLIVIPHGDLETRTIEISYRRLKVALFGVAVLALVVVVVVGMWFPILAQAGRVGGLERDLARLEAERTRVAELARTLAEVEAQYERVRELLGATGTAADSGAILPPLRSDSIRRMSQEGSGGEDGDLSFGAWPLASGGYITQVQSGAPGAHPGVDIAAPRNTQIRAAGPGVVREVGRNEVYGNYVVIDHGDGLESLYGHAARILIGRGDRVHGRKIIGFVGSTGQSSGYHLHFEVRRDGAAVDPLTYVRKP